MALREAGVMRVGNPTLTSLATLAAAVVVAAVLPLAAETPALAADGAAAATPSSTAWPHIAAGGSDTCGVSTNRTLWCWGNNAFGQLGLGNTTTETRPKQLTACRPPSTT
jgi:Regulator of chromosome condensation (RCC1) repeat